MELDFEQQFMGGKKVLFLKLIGFIVNIITLFIIIYKFKATEGIMALRYNVVTGVYWYDKGYNLFIVPAIAFIISCANIVLFEKLKTQQRFLAITSLCVSVSIQFILLAYVLLLIPVN